MSRVLLLRAGSREFALETAALLEVVDAPAVHAVPGARRLLLGAVNLHGRVLPVVDLALLVGEPGETPDPRLVALEAGDEVLVFAVSALDRMAAFETDELQLPPVGEEGELLAGVMEFEGRWVGLLDPRALAERLATIYMNETE